VFSKAQQAEQQVFTSVLKPEQIAKLRELVGQEFDTNGLKRIYPRAPELIASKHWLNSKSLTLAELRGKVVLLHFYAFQCHNCKANFDVYRRWHEKYGDKVVVIGIQTPETALERDPLAVTRAAGKEDLKFPILIDLESANWKNWSNTMWPTVYVIDKQGYLRQWWQGELRWQGATGDQAIEKLVGELLSESS
ncbi:redoxin domain-containing protein, partial [bacterium]|nr:redoxin domain-containing protein [bacterium]